MCSQGNRIDATSAEGIKLKYKARKEREAAAVRGAPPPPRARALSQHVGGPVGMSAQGRVREEAQREAERKAFVQSLAATGGSGGGGGGGGGGGVCVCVCVCVCVFVVAVVLAMYARRHALW